MSDKIYEDSISVSTGRFTVCTRQGPLWGVGRAIVFSKPPRYTKSLLGLKDDDLRDLHRALSEYLHMMGMSQ